MGAASKFSAAVAVLAASLAAMPASAETVFTTLGTQGGPLTSPHRSQPANLLTVNGVHTLVDVGDGTAGRLSSLRLQAFSVDHVLISHMHFDHIAGLLAILGLRYQTNSPKPLQVYGPPGTDVLVKGLLAGMAPAMEAGYGVPGEHGFTPEELVAFHVVKDGDAFELGETKVTVAANTHYSFPPESEQAEKFQSLSFRFDTPDRSIVYTGDTGPSDDVAELAKGADLLVGEMIDVDFVVGLIAKQSPDLAPERVANMKTHLAAHHLTPADLGKLAAAAGVEELVVTHLAPGGAMKDEHLERYRGEIAEVFSGKVTIASDLDRF